MTLCLRVSVVILNYGQAVTKTKHNEIKIILTNKNTRTMKQKILPKIKVLVFVFFAVLCTNIVTACGSDDEEEQQVEEYYIGPDKDGWYTFKDDYCVYDGEVKSASEEYVEIATTSPAQFWVISENITNKDCVQGDLVKIKMHKFKSPTFQTWMTSQIIYAEVELLNVKKQ